MHASSQHEAEVKLNKLMLELGAQPQVGVQNGVAVFELLKVGLFIGWLVEHLCVDVVVVWQGYGLTLHEGLCELHQDL